LLKFVAEAVWEGQLQALQLGGHGNRGNGCHPLSGIFGLSASLYKLVRQATILAAKISKATIATDEVSQGKCKEVYQCLSYKVQQEVDFANFTFYRCQAEADVTKSRQGPRANSNANYTPVCSRCGLVAWEACLSWNDASGFRCSFYQRYNHGTLDDNQRLLVSCD